MIVLWLATGLLSRPAEEVSGGVTRRRGPGRSLDVDESSSPDVEPQAIAEATQRKTAKDDKKKSGGQTLVGISSRAANNVLAQVAINAEQAAVAAAEEAYAARLLRDAEERAQIAQEIALLEALILEEQRIEQENEEAAKAFMAYLMAA